MLILESDLVVASRLTFFGVFLNLCIIVILFIILLVFVIVLIAKLITSF